MGMKIPKQPPSKELLWEEALEKGRFDAVYEASLEASGDGKYLHWDKLRFHTPPGDLSVKEWWLALKLSRSALMKRLPLRDVSDLPFMFGLPDPAPERLHYLAQRASGEIQVEDQAITNRDTKDRYIIRSLMEEAITSSQLEGAATTRLVAKQMLRSRRRPRDRDEQMILNNYMAMKHVREIKDKPMTKDLLLNLHHILTENAIDVAGAEGRFRRPEERIEISTFDNQVIYVPPPAKQLEERVATMCDFANSKTPNYFVNPVIRAIILHFWLAYDHPFADGNGRCARAMFYWSMLRQGYWLCEFISISEIIKQAPIKYGTAFLYTETDQNDLTYFILYHLEIIRKAIDKLHDYVARKAQAVRETERIMRSSSGFNHRQLALLSHALRHDDAEYTASSHQSSHNVSHQTALNDLYDLAQKGLLIERKIGRTYYFRPVDGLEKTLGSI